MRTVGCWTVISVVAWVAVGCAAPQRTRTKTPEIEVDEPFPKQAELEKIEPSADPSAFYQERRTHVEKWELKAPLPDELGVRSKSPETPWEQALSETVEAADGDVIASSGMHCLARQVGHFYLEKEAFPAGSLRDYIRTRCGVVAHSFSHQWWEWEKVPNASEEKLADHWKKKGKQKLAELANQGKHRSLGIWYGQDEEGAILLVTTGRRTAEITSAPLHVQSGTDIVIEGELFDEYRRVEALRTKSTFGYDSCEMDPSVDLPRFRIRCEPNGETGRTQIQFVAFRHRRGLGRVILSSAVWNDQTEDAVYRPTDAGKAVARAFEQMTSEVASDNESKAATGDSSAAGKSSEKTKVAATETEGGASGEEAAEGEEAEKTEGPTFELTNARQFIELVNLVREEAGMSSVAFEAGQSKQVQRLAGRYFRAQFEANDPKTAEKIALGLMAGWQVDADIISGTLASRAVQADRAEVLLERLVATPAGRRVLLEPEMDRMAVGLTRPADREATGAVVAAYRELPDESHEERASQAFETINEVRKEQGVSPLKRDHSLDAKLEDLARKIESGELEPGEAQHQMMSLASRLWNVRVSGAWSITNRLDALKLHEGLTAPNVERAAVLVVPYNDSEAAWTSYLVMTVFPAPKSEMASRATRDRRVALKP